MKEITKIFNKMNVRVFIKNNELFFSLTDVCSVLKLTNVTDTRRSLEKDYIDTVDVIDSMKRVQSIYIIKEAGLYQIIFRSRKKEAKSFKKWVFEEVLPSIRKTGKYSIPENIKRLSTNKRNALTDEWKAHGIEKPHHYIQLTLQEYKALNIKKGKKKKDFNKREILLLSALESMEMLKLFDDENINGYYECKDSLIETSNKVKQLTGSKNKELN